MHIHWLHKDEALPPPQRAQPQGTELAGLVAAGGDLSVARLKEAYAQGIFPWYSLDQPILWWSPDPRMVLKTSDFKLRRSLRLKLQQFIRDPGCEIRIDHAFDEVIQSCAGVPRKGQAGTWIVPEMVDAYRALHANGHAHSIETWQNGRLVGGLYCVAMGGAIFGESMFSLQADASKIALAALVAFARVQGLGWIDCQQNTAHLASLGAREMPRDAFLQLLSASLVHASHPWEFAPSYWDALFSMKS